MHQLCVKFEETKPYHPPSECGVCDLLAVKTLQNFTNHNNHIPFTGLFILITSLSSKLYLSKSAFQANDTIINGSSLQLYTGKHFFKSV